MKLHNTTLSGNENIAIHLCLGNKYFVKKHQPTQNVKNYIDWSLANTTGDVLCTVIDRIQDSNYDVRSHNSYAHNLRYVLRCGEKAHRNLNDLLSAYPQEAQERITAIRWDDYTNQDPHVSTVTQTVYKEFKNNVEFQKAVVKSVKQTVTDRPFTDEQYWRLADYVLDEFSLVYNGPTINDKHYGLYVYPRTDPVSDLIEAIKADEAFPELKEKLPDTTVAMGILN